MPLRDTSWCAFRASDDFGAISSHEIARACDTRALPIKGVSNGMSAAPLRSYSSLSSSRAEPSPQHAGRLARFRLDSVADDALHANVKSLTGRHNALTAELLAHLAEVDARGIYRERACSSLYTYCIYELRLSEDEAQRRVRAARTARAFPVLFEMLAEGAIHLTGLLLLAQHLTLENHAELLAHARFRTKREIEHLVAEVAPRPDVPARIVPLGTHPTVARNSWQAFTASLRGRVRELAPGLDAGKAPPTVASTSDAIDDAEPYALATDDDADGRSAPARVGAAFNAAGKPAPALADAAFNDVVSKPLAPVRYHVEFTASQRYVELLEEARNLLQHRVPDRDVAKVHEVAMEALVERLRKRRQAATRRSQRAGDAARPAPARETGDRSNVPAPARATGEGSEHPNLPAPARASGSPTSDTEPTNGRYVPAEVRREVWQRDGSRCTFEDSRGRRCEERAGLELHHEHAFALGGPPTLENLRLVCRAHNTLLAERDFGRAHVHRCVERARNVRPER